MSTTIKISNKLAYQAKISSKTENRSVSSQIEHWAHIGKIAEENPDLPFKLIKEIMIGMEQFEDGKSSKYLFG